MLHPTSVAFAVTLLAIVADGKGLKEEFKWTRIDYLWPQETRSAFPRYRPNRPSEVVRSDNGGFVFPGQTNIEKPTTTAPAVTSATPPPADITYIYENNVPMGANRWNNKLFVTVPRRRLGVPSTLNYVPLDRKERHNVPLVPYPDWETNALSDANDGRQRIVSVYRVAIDVCDRLWMVDTGAVEVLGNSTEIQEPAIVIIDLKTDKIVRRFPLPARVLKKSALANIAVDVTPKTCDDAYAYVPDLAGYGLIVYTYKDNDAWRVNHNYFYLESLAGDFAIGGHKFQWTDGVFSVELSDLLADGYRDLYFHSMAGTHMYKVSTKVLRDKSLATRSYHGDDFKVLGDRGKLSQTSAADLHKSTGIMFLSLVNRNAVGCWNTKTELKRSNLDVVHKDDDKMIYPCDMKIYQDQVITLSNKMPKFLYGQLNYDETNFRVWMTDVKDAVKDTKCATV